MRSGRSGRGDTKLIRWIPRKKRKRSLLQQGYRRKPMAKKAASQAVDRKRSPVGAPHKRPPVGAPHKSPLREAKGPPARHTRARMAPASQSRHPRTSRWRRWSFGMKTALVLGVAIGILGLLFFLSNQGTAGNSQASQYAYVVGNPGPGD